MSAPLVTFLTRRRCSLCEEALPRVQSTARRLGFEVAVTDVDDAGLSGRFGSRVPVVLGPGGEELASGRFGTGALLWALAKARLRI